MKPQRFSSRTRDLLSSQPGCNGKGDKSRVSDDKAYRERYDEINWHRDADNIPKETRVTEGSRCFCDGDPCRCDSELGYLQPAPGVLPVVPAKEHSEVAECGVRSAQRVYIDNSKPGF